jgi:hypothetical protein
MTWSMATVGVAEEGIAVEPSDGPAVALTAASAMVASTTSSPTNKPLARQADPPEFLEMPEDPRFMPLP